jgi:hypothetical protein
LADWVKEPITAPATTAQPKRYADLNRLDIVFFLG